MTVIARKVRQSWKEIGPLLSIHNDQEYDEAVERLNALIDEVGIDEGHPPVLAAGYLGDGAPRM